MDFFKSVFSTDHSPPRGTPPPENDEDSPAAAGPQANPAPAASPSADPASPSTGPAPASGWSFDGLIKTLSSKSESVIQNYRRDLEDFGAGLKKETAAIRDAAARALDASAAAAQESLESVGQVVDELGDAVRRGTAEILHSIDPADADEADPDPDPPSHGSARAYSRFEARVAAIQSDPSTFLEDPEDAEDFDKWRVGFQLAEKDEEINALKHENGDLEEFLEKFVPEMVNYETFWSRYFYRVDRLRQAEDARAKLVKRAISMEEEEEELSWEVDDDVDNNEKKDDGDAKKEESKEEESGQPSREEAVQEQEIKAAAEEVAKEVVIREADSPGVMGSIQASQFEKVGSSGEAEDDNETPSTADKADNAESNGEELASKSCEVGVHEGKTDAGDSCKDSEFSMVSGQPSMPEEDDLGWDEIEDLGEQDGKKVVVPSLNPSAKAELQKKLSSAENDEDLSWDVEEED